MKKNDKSIIAVDYGITTNDLPVFIAFKMINKNIEVINSGHIDDFNYADYVATKHQIIGSDEDLKNLKFNSHNKKGGAFHTPPTN